MNDLESRYNFVKFPQEGKTERPSYPAWRDRVLDIAAGMSDFDTLGMIGSLLSAAQYALISPDVYQPKVHPGLLPDDQELHANHKIRLNEFNKQENYLRILKKGMIESLSNTALQPMMEPGIVRMANRSVLQIYGHMFETYGRLTQYEIAREISKLGQEFDPNMGNLAEHMIIHVMVHNIAIENGQALTESHKIEYLKQSLNSCGVFKDAMAAYTRARPTMLQQTFNNFKEAMQLEYDSMDNLMTSAKAGYAGAANKNNSTPQTMISMAECHKLIDVNDQDSRQCSTVRGRSTICDGRYQRLFSNDNIA